MDKFNGLKGLASQKAKSDATRPSADDIWGDIPTEIWPGKRTDLASLERNAALYREEERRLFFKSVKDRVVASAKSLFAHRTAADKARTARQCCEAGSHTN
ncbi:hypothetical protein ACQQ2Q_14515 [Agrobacterium sp. ES01]|uniref:hypothetical protein n=1 Tax=Agrobacterium sp. ES01 TaxID=3420714 RepID=UPI003D124366